MAQAIIALSSPHQARNPDPFSTIQHEWMAATYVWVNLELNSPKQRRLHVHLSHLEDRLRSLGLQSSEGGFSHA
jgi:hypothetical protein